MSTNNIKNRGIEKGYSKSSTPENDNNSIILQVKNVSMHFGELKALDEVSFEVKRGEIFGIAGPNGAGKTTLFNVIAGMLKGSGEIIFDGVNISGLGPHQICHKGIARTFQIPNPFLTLSVYDNVRVGAFFGHDKRKDHHEREKLIDEILHLVGLESKKKEKVASLDIFDKKLTMLAASLATEPRMLLLDEPVGGLSPSEIKQFINLVMDVKNKLDLTIIVIEHLMPVLTDISHRMMILDNGKKICIGPPEVVVRDPKVREIYLGEYNA